MARSSIREPELFPPPRKPAAKPTVAVKAKPAVVVPPPRRQDVAIRVARPPQPMAPTPENVLGIINRAANDPKCSPEKMRSLYELQKEVMADAAKTAFTRAFIALQADLPTIRPDGKIEIREKDGTGQRRGRMQQSTPYATFQNIMRTVKPLLQKHEFTLSFPPDVGTEGRIIVRGHLRHAAGQEMSCSIPLPLETSGSKNNVQGVGSSISYGKRYATIAMLNIISEAPEDKDTDGNQNIEPEKLSKADVAKLRKAVVDSVGEVRFCEKYEIETVADLAPAMLGEALTACAQFRVARDGKTSNQS